jgi:hypothetical protein
MIGLYIKKTVGPPVWVVRTKDWPLFLSFLAYGLPYHLILNHFSIFCYVNPLWSESCILVPTLVVTLNTVVVVTYCYKLSTQSVEEKREELSLEINSFVHSPMLIAYWL